jgi:hypothetical protein
MIKGRHIKPQFLLNNRGVNPWQSKFDCGFCLFRKHYRGEASPHHWSWRRNVFLTCSFPPCVSAPPAPSDWKTLLSPPWIINFFGGGDRVSLCSPGWLEFTILLPPPSKAGITIECHQSQLIITSHPSTPGLSTISYRKSSWPLRQSRSFCPLCLHSTCLSFCQSPVPHLFLGPFPHKAWALEVERCLTHTWSKCLTQLAARVSGL